METNLTDRTITADFYGAIQIFVNREVHACISGIVFQMSSVYGDDAAYGIRRRLGKLDYEEAAIQEGWKLIDGQWGHGYSQELYDDANTLCDAEGIELIYHEIYEHWIVSSYLADKLLEAGETVDKDFYGSCVWGRITTGQAICMDRVICDIYDAMTAA